MELELRNYIFLIPVLIIPIIAIAETSPTAKERLEHADRRTAEVHKEFKKDTARLKAKTKQGLKRIDKKAGEASRSGRARIKAMKEEYYDKPAE